MDMGYFKTQVILLNSNVRFTTTDFPRILTVFVPPLMVLTLSLRFTFNSEICRQICLHRRQNCLHRRLESSRSQFTEESAIIPVERFKIVVITSCLTARSQVFVLFR